jgi:predicted DNA-binding transcriptional regulator AlpA
MLKEKNEMAVEVPIYTLPSEGFLRLNQIVGSKGMPAIIPVSRSSWWAGVKDGRFPKPVKLGKRTTAWKVSDIRAIIEGNAI